jgi:hypothetical protein
MRERILATRHGLIGVLPLPPPRADNTLAAGFILFGFA